jgi:ribosomal-protein-serine acetyltransferase
MASPFYLRVNEHLELRQRAPEDAEELFALTDANRTRLRTWLPWLDHCTRPEHTLASIESTLRQAEAGMGLAFCLWSEGRIAGVGGYNLIDRANLTGHIGYWLGDTFEGRGLMTAANRALIGHGFSELGLRRQTISAATGNARSRAVAERLGFRLEGVLRSAEQLYGRRVDHAFYAQTSEDWEQETRASADRLAIRTGTAPLDLVVRAMNPTDVREALNLWNATEGMGLSPEETEPMLAAFLARNPGLSAVARSPDGALLGAVLAGHDGRRGFLYHLAVAPTHRGKGGGRALAAFALAGLRAAGIARTSLLVYANNEAGQAFWRHLDWEARNDLVLMQTKHALDS